ncbi:AAA family ATPase [Aerosakkonemataceae cyanobacterium BLCC-F154]|uniref:AAA family ATPase n=1 Tax=Floridaenema fluviatile BLCC-F154 TaxID=3153640 RepID=A0ABV4YDE0_9CYAN
MTTNISTFSPIEKLNAAIQSQNPFARAAVVRASDIWGKGFPDVPSLNAHASDAIFKAIQQVSSSQGKVTSLAITAEKGVGKTHLIGRIRHHLQADGSGLFIYAGATRFTHPSLIKYQFLQILSDSLNQIGSEGVKQWQELATAMLNAATKTQVSPKEMIEKKFPFALAKNQNLLDHLTASILKTKSNSDPYIIRAILWTLSDSNASYAIKWLSGNDLSEAEAAKLGLPNIDKEQREANAFESVLQILALLSDYKPVVICFDELEIINPDESSFPKPQAVAELVKNLFDSLNLSSTSHGVVILTVMMPDTWPRIKQLSGGIPDRVSSETPNAIELRHIDSDSITKLVTIWLKGFYRAKNLVPHHPLYPFTENQLGELAKERPPVRKVLQWCAANFQNIGRGSSSDSGTTQSATSSHPVQAAYSKELANVDASINSLMEDKAALADALRWGFQIIIKLGETIEDVKVHKLEEIEPRRENSGYIDFKILVKQNGRAVKIGVAVLQQSSTQSLLAGLKRLVKFRTFGINRSCLVRAKEINQGATQAQECLNKLLSSKRGEWVPLKVNAIKSLLAIRFVYLSQEDHGLTENQILEFISQTKLVINNYLIRKILSEPTGEIPNLDDKDEPLIIGEITNLNGKNEPSVIGESVKIDKSAKQVNTDLYWINKIAEVGNSSDGHTFEKFVRKALIELGFKNSNSRSEASLDPDATGGAGGLDFYCEEPYLVVGECKATKSEKVPDGTPAQLIKLGNKHLQEKYAHCIKLIVAAGELTTPAQQTAVGNKINIVRPETLQKLVKMQVNHRGSVDLLKLKQCLEEEPFGLADNKVNRYIDKVYQHILMRSHIVETVKQLGEVGSEHPTIAIRAHYNVMFAKEQTPKLDDLPIHELLIELSSPLAGYLGRKKGSDWQSDRFYYLRDLTTRPL